MSQSDYRLNDDSVDAVRTQEASFDTPVRAGDPARRGELSSGLFNGQAPSSAADAQLLNTVCQVAYVSAGGLTESAAPRIAGLSPVGIRPGARIE